MDIQEKTKVGEYLVVDDLPGLVALVQMGILEIHTWNSTTRDVERPDRLVFDLDPGPKVAFAEVVRAVRELRERLDALSLESFVKTTGGKGLHVVVPLQPRAGWEGCFALSRAISEAMAREDRGRYTTAMPKAGREDKILIDTFRNNRGNTSVTPYSTRAWAGAPVSVPLAWDELTPRLRPDQWTIATLPGRLSRLRRDPWAGYADVRQSATAALLRRAGAAG